MTLSLILKRLSVQVAAVGGTLTTVAGTRAAAGTVIAAVVPQASWPPITRKPTT